ncbi:hypothetical protein [Methylomonas rivi]|uniref:Uncharacterized protein n=1 Tax=Methylomonas rivi TaxID=2952226 RepID=A0ABT1U984_9GAMM|nr:hypothetical protein [Methylomonas sp. WSC-6]MCQ8130424.1 hypothetical protein [Methylomonas sp. WSC-6]
MNTKEFEVIVIARKGIDLVNLARHDGPLAIPCGTVGPSVAKAVLEGKGKAKVSMLNLKIAIDTQYGVESILDNFELYDSTTRKPLLWSLVAARLNCKQ